MDFISNIANKVFSSVVDKSPKNSGKFNPDIFGSNTINGVDGANGVDGIDSLKKTNIFDSKMSTNAIISNGSIIPNFIPLPIASKSNRQSKVLIPELEVMDVLEAKTETTAKITIAQSIIGAFNKIFSILGN
jgi:hypothetical protein